MRNIALCVVLFIFGCGIGTAQETVLWSFGGPPNDGARPVADLVSDASGNLFGTTASGGNSTASACDGGCGTIFELSPGPRGTWKESVLYNFCTNFVDGQCLDGSGPLAGLVVDLAGNLYGTTYAGGSEPCPIQLIGCGTIFQLSPGNGGVWTETVLHNFCSVNANSLCLDGAVPAAQLTFDALGNLYGTSVSGGSASAGVVFEISVNSGVWTQSVVYNFCSTGQGVICPDGRYPYAGVTFDASGNMYGTTEVGGSFESQGSGTVYELISGESGWTEAVLLRSTRPYPGPAGTVSFDEMGNLYSTTPIGPGGWGDVFRLSPKGNLSYFQFDEIDGFAPSAGVLVDSKRHAILGTTVGGGGEGSGHGTVFKISADDQFSTLYNFCPRFPCTDGIQPWSSLIEDKAGRLYGTTEYGGANSTICQGSGCGVVFQITP